MSDVLQVTQASSEALQTRDNYDYAMATMNIKAVQLTLDQWRNTTEQPRGFFEQSWNKTIVTLRRYKVLPKIPRVSAKTRSRLNLTSNEPYEYYRKALALPLLDHMRSELRIRFDSRSRILSQLAFLIPSVMLRDRNDIPNAVDFLDAVRFYRNDLPSPDTFDTEYVNWRNTWLSHSQFKNVKPLPNSVTSTLKNCPTVLYPNIWHLLQIFGVIPVSADSNERMFSTLKRTKTRLRSTMGEV